ncbi:hypothetical protein [Methylobacterium nodulans]|uniref:Uncharacterized protein n=1 Tax=Methylobacterium nodulans (strain LMG 21967 / CNCM I-2342 / ORS 2060) TaxID=460265 RepID=B8IE50_METNO|nr:hypothetical protein [Methylobacterium nodulans]ACL57596.1 hypothetical protein Mnod_2633 [Methylobacterium nodulans ORS 2060]
MRNAPLASARLSIRTSDDGYLIVPADVRLRRPLALSAAKPRETFPAFEPPLFLREPLPENEPQREPADRDWLATGLVIIAAAILIALALGGGALVNAVREGVL